MKKIISILISIIFIIIVITACNNDVHYSNSTLMTSPSNDAISKGNIYKHFFVPSTNLNIRSGAGTSYEVIYVATNGEYLEMTGERQQISDKTTWYEVKSPNGTGWCTGELGSVIYKEAILDDNGNTLIKDLEIEKALDCLVMGEDKVEKAKWYAPNTFPMYKNSRTFVLPFFVESEGNYQLMIRYSYYGAFLGWNHIKFALDDERYEKYWNYSDIEREFDNNFSSCEIFTDVEPTLDDINILRKISTAKEAIIRFYNDDGKYYDYLVDESDKAAIRQVLNAYDVIYNWK